MLLDFHFLALYAYQMESDNYAHSSLEYHFKFVNLNGVVKVYLPTGCLAKC